MIDWKTITPGVMLKWLLVGFTYVLAVILVVNFIIATLEAWL